MHKCIEIQSEDFDVATVLADMRAKLGADVGAIVTFTGLVRDQNPHAAGAASVANLTLEHYPGMTERSIERILDEAETRWPLLAVHLTHRVGTMVPADQIVLVVVASAHRDAAFASAEFIMDYLKTNAVFWKKEHTQEGSHWVQSTDLDHDRSHKWRS